MPSLVVIAQHEPDLVAAFTRGPSWLRIRPYRLLYNPALFLLVHVFRYRFLVALRGRRLHIDGFYFDDKVWRRLRRRHLSARIRALRKKEARGPCMHLVIERQRFSRSEPVLLICERCDATIATLDPKTGEVSHA